ncbi:hypothetical protein ACTJIJ_23035 [Niabella sp. 22666]|uniref:hypothetical protein n=1 Tax=Niabella sp. 22666 TaxID=3453954 RepID=UPI003F8793DC
MFDRAIYNINYKRLMLQHVPTELRKPKLLALITALLSPVVHVYAIFNNYKLEVEYRLKLTPQVCSMQWHLNNLYDYDQRRIYIEDAPRLDTMILRQEVEGREVVLPLEGEEEAEGIMYLEEESLAMTDDFIVVMPLELQGNINELQLRARIDAVKLPTKKYTIRYE